MSKLQTAPRTSVLRRAVGVAVAVAAAMSTLGVVGASPATAAQPADKQGGPPTKVVTAAEKARAHGVDKGRMQREAKPFELPSRKGKGTAPERQGPDGPAQKVEPAGGSGGAAASSSTSTSTSAASQNGYWPGAYNSNPNRQIGKLYFDVAPGSAVDWRHCSATAVNSENKSMIVSAGHCVYNPDPDGNGVISGNGYWFENFWFCPGYENGCHLGWYTPRQVSTTWSWFGGVGGYYDFRDDVAVLLMNGNANGLLVNYVGGHGITFNQPTTLYRYAFGYPVSDWRWPAYTYSGEDLAYCPGYSYNDGSIPGTMWMACTMTGGSSGGAWLTYVQSSWLGYVNSVNSHKPYGGEYMSGPYFNQQEADLYNYWRSR